MKIIETYEVSMPDYVVCYLVNRDDSGLLPDDKTACDKALAWYYHRASELKGYAVFDFDFEPQHDPYFTWHPMFGLACNCYDCKINIIGG